MVYVNGTLTVSKATLVVTANNQTSVYGTAIAAYTATITGFVNGDPASVVTGTAALSTSPATPTSVGSYTITAAQGTLAASNYGFTFATGTLTITKATLTVTAGNASRAYGVANPTFTATATGAVNGDSFSFTESTTATTSSPVGTYAIVPVATGANLANYTVVYVNGTLTVGQATLTVTAGNASRAYGRPTRRSPHRPPVRSTATASASPRARPQPRALLSGPTRSSRWRLVRTWRTTQWSMSTAP